MASCVNFSDYYLQDVPYGTPLMSFYVTSQPKQSELKGQKINRSKFHAHRVPTSWEFEGVCGAYNTLSFLGKGLKAIVSQEPEDNLIQHWERAFGNQNTPEFASQDTNAKRLVNYPLESVPPEQYHVDPEVLYKIQSKKFIEEIDVAQAKIIDGFRSPCVVKATHGCCAEAVYFVRTEEEFEEAKEKLAAIPHSEYIVTELIPDVVMTYLTHCYITKKGEVQWIGAAEQYLPGTKHTDILEVIMRMNDQEELKELLFPLCQRAGEALHREGYFGYCGNDIVVDKEKRAYVVDVNPRFNGSAPLILSSFFVYQKKKFSVSINRRVVRLKRDIEINEIIEKLENIENGLAVLVFAFPQGDALACCFRVYANSEEMCEDIYDQISHI